MSVVSLVLMYAWLALQAVLMALHFYVRRAVVHLQAGITPLESYSNNPQHCFQPVCGECTSEMVDVAKQCKVEYEW